jgi:hypothetical protein
VPLDFIVIGAQKAGTTSLWEYLRTHPQIQMPGDKEVPFFCVDARYRRGLPWYEREYLPPPVEGTITGTATTQYMHGTKDATVETIAARMKATIPDVKLVAMLRDPIERAFSQYRHMVRKGYDARSFDEVVRGHLRSGALRRARQEPRGTNTYLVQGEYGRILHLYLAHFPRHQIEIALTADLDAEPERTMRGLFRFLGVDSDHVPDNLTARFHRGGTSARIDQEAVRKLKGRLAERIWRLDSAPSAADRVEFERWFDREWNRESGRPLLSADAEHELKDYFSRHVWSLTSAPTSSDQRGFNYWLEAVWNVDPSESAVPLDAELRSQLQDHFARDAALLLDGFGVEVPWLVPGAASRPASHTPVPAER